MAEGAPANPMLMTTLFPDTNLHLAVLDALASEGHVKLPNLKTEDAYKPDSAVRQALLDIPLGPDDLAKVKQLVWEGGMEIQHAIWNQWDGEDEYFDIRDLSGIEQLSKLERVDILTCCRVEDWSPLEKCASLRSVTVPAEASPTFDALQARGVEVELG